MHAHTIPAERVSDYREPRYTYTSDVHLLAKRCQHDTCFAAHEHDCGLCGDPLCDDHAHRCEERECFERDAMFCLKCSVLIDGGARLCLRHAKSCGMNEEAV